MYIMVTCSSARPRDAYRRMNAAQVGGHIRVPPARSPIYRVQVAQAAAGVPPSQAPHNNRSVRQDEVTMWATMV